MAQAASKELMFFQESEREIKKQSSWDLNPSPSEYSEMLLPSSHFDYCVEEGYKSEEWKDKLQNQNCLEASAN